MKKLLSVILSASMLMGIYSFSASAESASVEKIYADVNGIRIELSDTPASTEGITVTGEKTGAITVSAASEGNVVNLTAAIPVGEAITVNIPAEVAGEEIVKTVMVKEVYFEDYNDPTLTHADVALTIGGWPGSPESQYIGHGKMWFVRGYSRFYFNAPGVEELENCTLSFKAEYYDDATNETADKNSFNLAWNVTNTSKHAQDAVGTFGNRGYQLLYNKISRMYPKWDSTDAAVSVNHETAAVWGSASYEPVTGSTTPTSLTVAEEPVATAINYSLRKLGNDAEIYTDEGLRDVYKYTGSNDNGNTKGYIGITKPGKGAINAIDDVLITTCIEIENVKAEGVYADYNSVKVEFSNIPVEEIKDGITLTDADGEIAVKSATVNGNDLELEFEEELKKNTIYTLNVAAGSGSESVKVEEDFSYKFLIKEIYFEDYNDPTLTHADVALTIGGFPGSPESQYIGHGKMWFVRGYSRFYFNAPGVEELENCTLSFKAEYYDDATNETADKNSFNLAWNVTNTSKHAQDAVGTYGNRGYQLLYNKISRMYPKWDSTDAAVSVNHATAAVWGSASYEPVTGSTSPTSLTVADEPVATAINYSLRKLGNDAEIYTDEGLRDVYKYTGSNDNGNTKGYIGITKPGKGAVNAIDDVTITTCVEVDESSIREVAVEKVYADVNSLELTFDGEAVSEIADGITVTSGSKTLTPKDVTISGNIMDVEFDEALELDRPYTISVEDGCGDGLVTAEGYNASFVIKTVLEETFDDEDPAVKASNNCLLQDNKYWIVAKNQTTRAWTYINAPGIETLENYTISFDIEGGKATCWIGWNIQYPNDNVQNNYTKSMSKGYRILPAGVVRQYPNGGTNPDTNTQYEGVDFTQRNFASAFTNGTYDVTVDETTKLPTSVTVTSAGSQDNILVRKNANNASIYKAGEFVDRHDWQNAAVPELKYGEFGIQVTDSHTVAIDNILVTTCEVAEDEVVALDFEVTDADGAALTKEALASATAINCKAYVDNLTAVAKPVVIMCALYGENNVMKAVSVSEITEVDAFSNKAPEFSFTNVSGVSTVKMFILDGFGNLVPYCNALSW